MHESKPLISVITTSYNMALTVEKAIFSILNQSYSNLELIVVDDASTDETVKLVSAIQDTRIRVFKNTINCGTYFCKNFGITKANGQFITLQDADDFSDPYRLAKCIDTFTLNPALKIVKVAYLRFYKNSNLLWFRSYVDGVQTAMVKKEVFTELGFFDHVLVSADSEFIDRAKAVYGKQAVFTINQFLYFALLNDDGLTAKTPLHGDVRSKYTANYAKWHRSEKKHYMTFPLIKRPFQAPEANQAKPQYNPENCFQLVHAPATNNASTEKNKQLWYAKTHAQIENFNKQIMFYYATVAAKLNHDKA